MAIVLPGQEVPIFGGSSEPRGRRRHRDDENTMEVASALFRRLDPSDSGLIHEEQVLPLWPALTQHVEGGPIELSEHRQRRGAPISCEEWQSLMSALRSIIGDRRFKSSVKRADALAAKRSVAGARVQLPPLASSASAPALLPVPGAIDTSPRSLRPIAGAGAAYPSAQMTPMKNVGFAPAAAAAPPVPAAKPEETVQEAAEPIQAKAVPEPLLDTSQLSEATLKPEESTIKPWTPSRALCEVLPDFSSSPMAARRYTQGLSVLGLAVPQDLVDPSTSPPSSPSSSSGPRLQSPTPSRSRSGKAKMGGQTFLNDFTIRSGQSSANPSRNRSQAATPIPRAPSHLGSEVGEEALLSRLKLYESIQEEDEETEGADAKKTAAPVKPEPAAAEQLDEQVRRAAAALAAAAFAATPQSSADEARVAEALAAAALGSASAPSSGKETQQETTARVASALAASALGSTSSQKVSGEGTPVGSPPPPPPRDESGSRSPERPRSREAPPSEELLKRPQTPGEPDAVTLAATALAEAAFRATPTASQGGPPPLPNESTIESEQAMKAAPPPLPQEEKTESEQKETSPKSVPGPESGETVPDSVHQAAAALASAALGPRTPKRKVTEADEARIVAALAAAALGSANAEPDEEEEEKPADHTAIVAAALASAVGAAPKTPSSEERSALEDNTATVAAALASAVGSAPKTSSPEEKPAPPVPLNDSDLQAGEDGEGTQAKAAPPAPPPVDSKEVEMPEEISKAAAALATAACQATPKAKKQRASQEAEARIAAVLAAAAFNVASPVQSVKDRGDSIDAEIAAAVLPAAEEPASPGHGQIDMQQAMQQKEPPPPPPAFPEEEQQTTEEAKDLPPPPPPVADDDYLAGEDDMGKSAPPPPPPPGMDEEADVEQATSKSVVTRFEEDVPQEQKGEDDEYEDEEASDLGVESDVEQEISNAILLVQAQSQDEELGQDAVADIAESVSFARRFRKLKETSGIANVRRSISKPRPSAPPKFKPLAGRTLDSFDYDDDEEGGQPNDVMGLICRMYTLEADGGFDDEEDAYLGGEISPATYSHRKMRKQKTWHDDLASKFFWGDDDEDQMMEPADEESTEIPSTMLSHSRKLSDDQRHSRSLGSEQDSSSSWNSTGKLPALKRSHTAPLSFDLLPDDDEDDVGDILSGEGGSEKVKALKSRLRDELHMHHQTRVHAEELERKLKLANAKITQGPTVKRESRFGITNPRPYAGKPMPIPRKANRGVYLPALKPLKPSSPKRDAGDAVLPAVQSLLEESRMNTLSRSEQSRSRVDAFGRLGHVGMSTWNVRRAEKVSRFQDMNAFSESVWGSFYDWNETYKSTG